MRQTDIGRAAHSTSSAVHRKMLISKKVHGRLVNTTATELWPSAVPRLLVSEHHDRYRGLPEPKVSVDLSRQRWHYNAPTKREIMAPIPLNEGNYSRHLDPYVSTTTMDYSAVEPSLLPLTTFWSQHHYSSIKGTLKPMPGALPPEKTNKPKAYGGENYNVDRNFHNRLSWAPTAFVTQNRKTYVHPQIASRLASKYNGNGGVFWSPTFAQ